KRGDEHALDHADDDVKGGLAPAPALEQPPQPVAHLPVHLAHDDVDAADDGHHVGDEMANAHRLQELQVDEARGAVVAPVRLVRTVSHQVHADFAAGRFDAGVHVAHQLHPPRHVAQPRAAGDGLNGLADDADGFVELVHAHDVAGVNVAVLAYRDVELEPVVHRVRVRLAQVLGDAATPQHRPTGAVGDGLLLGNHPDALGAGFEDAVAGEEFVVLDQPLFEEVKEAEDVLLETFIEVVANAADPQGVVEHAGARQLLEDVEQAFPFAEGVEEGGHSAQVQGERAKPEQVAGDALHFAHDDPDVLGALGHFDAHQLFRRHHVSPLAGDGREVVGAVAVGDDHLHRAPFRDLFEAAVQVADVRLERQNPLAVNTQQEPQHPVRAGVLGSHVDEELVLGRGRRILLYFAGHSGFGQSRSLLSGVNAAPSAWAAPFYRVTRVRLGRWST